jgi:transposase-like protein
MSENKAPKPAADKGAKGSEEKRPEEIRQEIKETREELGDTVAAVAEKTDVKKQAKAKVDDLKAQARAAVPESPTEGAQQARALAKQNPTPLAIAGVVVGLLVLWRLLRR